MIDFFEVLNLQVARRLFEAQHVHQVVVARLVEQRDIAVQVELGIEHVDDRTRADLETGFGRLQRRLA